MFLKRLIRLGALCAVLAPVSAFANTIVWKDPVHDFTMSYPDDWRVQTPDTALTRLRVAGPLGEDLPTCRMKVVEDGRVKIYPKTYVDDMVRTLLPREFWEGEAAQYEAARITQFYDPASLGNKGDATAVRLTFLMDGGQGKVPMEGIMIGAIYGDKRFLASCSSRAEVYARWSPLFMSILDSVELETRYHPFATGYYRNFLEDPALNLPRSKPGTPREPEKRLFYRLFGDKYHQ